MRFAPLEVENGLVFVILWTAKVVNKTKKSMDPLIFWPISQAFQPKNVSNKGKPSYFGCPKINCEILFSRISSWVFYENFSSLVSGTYVWLFIELSEQNLIFSCFFRFFLMILMRRSLETYAFLDSSSVDQEIHDSSMIFSSKSSKKNEKKRKNQILLRQFDKQSYIRAGNERCKIFIKTAWTDPQKKLNIIKCWAPKIAWLETFFGWKT